MNELALVDVGMPSQVGASHRAGVVAVREAALDELPTTAAQSLAAAAPDPAAVGVVTACTRLGVS